eukprot:TRINITY_DN6779_c0_g2_i14.p1 TRINITY_DN6779_c0_g2~~TRINITY_DN6779_c0_g2_i14.p1  ORF type:complete len:351 (+),score=108.04 TRINITY_DN6779_c0_g2_i14:733-1785(+)
MFPLCCDCSKIVSNELTKALLDINRDIQNFCGFSLLEMDSFDGEEEALRKASEECSELRKELSALEEEGRILEQDLEQLREAEENLEYLEKVYWKSYSTFRTELMELKAERTSLDLLLDYGCERLKKTRRSFVLNDTFHVWHNGHFGTINGCRLGKLPSQPVDSTEINAAWGLTATLLCHLSKMVGLSKFSEHEIIPMGSQTILRKYDGSDVIELFGENEGSFFRFYWNHKYDRAMVTLLKCTNEIISHIKSKDPSFAPPYKINDDLINNLSVRLQFNAEEKWTKALKFLLTDVKFIVSWVSLKQEFTVSSSKTDQQSDIDMEANVGDEETDDDLYEINEGGGSGGGSGR